MTRSLRTSAAAAIAAAAALTPMFIGTTAADATPSSGVSAVTLAHTDIPAGLLPFVPKGAHVEVRQIKIEPGGTTGWHYHDADIYALVRQGTLTHPYANCKPVVYKTGDIIVEPGGKSNVHEGTNLGKVPVILDVVYVTPFGKPLSEDSPAPSCA
ncbi:Cupin domain [Gordonia paraffinivorans]|uniref:Cupin domain n=1 Tax=Gordonia paraffinivorans TaxID=175628 RepID=A0ABD7V278_9ACTN|nr:cupin domain-containing protein [Gordonia paraffinivorans]VFA88375.1 Cupin domain [Gordonia paraffinivorans]